MTDQPVGDIIKGITDDVKLLVRDEIALAKSELIPTAKKAAWARACSARPATSRSARCRSSTSRPRTGWSAFGSAAWLALPDRRRRTVPCRGDLGGIGFMIVRKVKGPERTIAQANQTVAEVKDRSAARARRRERATDRG